VLQINGRVIAAGATGIHGCREDLRDHGQHVRRRIHPAKEARVTVPHGVREYLLSKKPQDFVGR
jgi:hypothetical protein